MAPMVMPTPTRIDVGQNLWVAVRGWREGKGGIHLLPLVFRIVFGSFVGLVGPIRRGGGARSGAGGQARDVRALDTCSGTPRIAAGAASRRRTWRQPFCGAAPPPTSRRSAPPGAQSRKCAARRASRPWARPAIRHSLEESNQGAQHFRSAMFATHTTLLTTRKADAMNSCSPSDADRRRASQLAGACSSTRHVDTVDDPTVARLRGREAGAEIEPGGAAADDAGRLGDGRRDACRLRRRRRPGAHPAGDVHLAHAVERLRIAGGILALADLSLSVLDRPLLNASACTTG